MDSFEDEVDTDYGGLLIADLNLMNLLLRLVADSALAEPSTTRILRTLDDTYLRRGVSLSIMVVCCLVFELFCRSNFSHLCTNLQDVISPKVDAPKQYRQSYFHVGSLHQV
jgi:hypothetical protein